MTKYAEIELRNFKIRNIIFCYSVWEIDKKRRVIRLAKCVLSITHSLSIQYKRKLEMIMRGWQKPFKAFQRDFIVTEN
jgi:hypothetical protein